MTDRTQHAEGRTRNSERPGASGGARPQRLQEDKRATLEIPNPTRPLAEQPLPVLLAMCLFGEARGESNLTKRAVARVLLNRAQHPHAVFGSRRGAGLAENLRRVILQPWQFSSLHPADPNFAKLLRPLEHEAPEVWAACLECAQEALARHDAPDTLTANSDHYFDDSIQPPTWADSAKHTVQIGRLNFYRLYAPPPPAEATEAEEISPPPVSGSLPTAGIAGAAAGGSTRPVMGLPAPRARGFRAVGPGPYRRYDWRGGLSILALLLVSGLLAACNDVERTAYRTLAVTKAEYETLQRHVAEAAVHGLITEEQWDRFQAAGHQFIDAHNTAVDAFQMWSRTKSQSNAARLEALLELLPRLIREINSLVESFEKEESEVRSQKSECRPPMCHPEPFGPQRSRPPGRLREGAGPAFLLISDSALWLPAFPSALLSRCISALGVLVILTPDSCLLTPLLWL